MEVRHTAVGHAECKAGAQSRRFERRSTVTHQEGVFFLCAGHSGPRGQTKMVLSDPAGNCAAHACVSGTTADEACVRCSTTKAACQNVTPEGISSLLV